jgi:uracil-DNA glycosylase family 4
MFTGDSSGDFLYGALYELGLANQARSTARGDGLALDGVYIGATARCAPPDNRPTPAEIATCRPYLVREMKALPSLRVIACLGGIAWEGTHASLRGMGLLGEASRPPRFGHGATWRISETGLWVVGIYHPSRQNTQTGRLTKAMFLSVLRRAWTLATGG